MKHCHCGFKEHCRELKVGKLGTFGIVFVILHLLYHLVECLLLPAIFVAVANQSTNASNSDYTNTVTQTIKKSPTITESFEANVVFDFSKNYIGDYDL